MHLSAYALLLASALALCSTSTTAKDQRPQGQNCDLVQPPSESGEEAHMGTKLLVFPRAKNIASTYFGCQGLWIPYKEKYELAMLVEITNGDPVRTWSAVPTKQPGEDCRYRMGEVVAGDRSKCTDPKFLILKSVPAGCFPKIQAAAAAGKGWPEECGYD
jgi:hypothetical protein